MKKYLIERHIPGVHKFTAEEYAGATKVSNEALAKLAPRIQWVESYVTEDQTLCVYIADDESVIHEHAALRFPGQQDHRGRDQDRPDSRLIRCGRRMAGGMGRHMLDVTVVLLEEELFVHGDHAGGGSSTSPASSGTTCTTIPPSPPSGCGSCRWTGTRSIASTASA